MLVEGMAHGKNLWRMLKKAIQGFIGKNKGWK
jgi:hypothetical protein